VKTLVGFEIFVDFVRFFEQFFVGETNCASDITLSTIASF
jgi:hypothetical protein